MTRSLISKALWFSLVPVALALTVSASASAEPEFDVAVKGGKVVVVAKGAWHINTKYPWKLTIGDKKLGKDAFKLTDHQASVAAPKGKGTIKGGVCNKDQCMMFKKDVDIH